MRPLFRIFLFCLISALCFGGSIVYLRIHKNALAERIKANPASPSERVPRLRSLFQAAGCTANQIAEQPVPKEELPNVLCRLPGTEPGTIVVSAPIDFETATSDDQARWATAAMLPLLAESLAPAPHRFSMTFVALSGHDHGSRGSTEFLKALSEVQRKEIRAMISLEEVGRTPLVYVLGQEDPLLANWLSVAATTLHVRAIPAEINARTVNAQLINGVPDFHLDAYVGDSRPFQREHVPTIALRSAPSAMIPWAQKTGAWSTNVAGDSFSLDVFEQTYNQLCVYLLLLDSNLGTSHAAPTGVAMAAVEETTSPPPPSASAGNAPRTEAPGTVTQASNASAPGATGGTAPQPASQPTQPTTPPDIPVFRAQTELVLMDVSVTDAKGAPIRGLKQSDFTLLEDGSPQQIRDFEEHESENNEAPKAAVVALPSGTYTNRTAVGGAAPLGILLFDLLNTPVQDQAYARAQMIQYLKSMPQGEHLALFVLGTNLQMVQGFTDNPASLVQAAEKTIRDVSPLYTTEAQKQQDIGFTEEIGRHASPTVANAPSEVTARLAATEADSENFIGSVSQRNASRAAMEGTLTDQRTTMTLDALSAIARTVGGYPGRKNMIWLSGSFQIRLHPTENSFLTIGARTSQAANPVADLTNTANYQATIRQVSTLLAAARLAVYPIDIRGIQNGGVDLTVGSDQSRVMANSAAPDSYGKTLVDQSETRFGERSSMEDLADQTGGQVFLNNDVRGSIQRGLQNGASYYTLAYTPEKSNTDPKFRRVEVKLSQSGVKLAYRPGYYPISSQDSLKQNGAHKLAAAMQPGLPPSTMLIVTARVQPPDASSKTVRIDYSIDTASVVFTGMPNQNRRAVLDCMTVAIDGKGAIAGQVANTMDAQIPLDQFSGYQKTGLPLHQELTLPPGKYDLRLGVMDRASQRVGTLAVNLVVPEPDVAKQ